MARPPLYMYGTTNHLPTREHALAVCRQDQWVYVIQHLSKDRGYEVVRCGLEPLYKHQHALIIHPGNEIIEGMYRG